jgi:hypothetical protein
MLLEALIHHIRHNLSGRVKTACEHFKQQQLTKAELITDEVSKNATVDAIEQVFSEENKHNAYGKKLMLIENSIITLLISCSLRVFSPSTNKASIWLLVKSV